MTATAPVLIDHMRDLESHLEKPFNGQSAEEGGRHDSRFACWFDRGIPVRPIVSLGVKGKIEVDPGTFSLKSVISSLEEDFV